MYKLAKIFCCGCSLLELKVFVDMKIQHYTRDKMHKISDKANIDLYYTIKKTNGAERCMDIDRTIPDFSKQKIECTPKNAEQANSRIGNISPLHNSV
jgi:hypothetical protein